MNRSNNGRRFLRDKEIDCIWVETKELLRQLLELDIELDFLFSYIENDIVKRLIRGRETLSWIESGISLLRKIDPPPEGIINLLVAAANNLQAEQREIRDGLSTLLKRFQGNGRGRK